LRFETLFGLIAGARQQRAEVTARGAAGGDLDVVGIVLTKQLSGSFGELLGQSDAGEPGLAQPSRPSGFEDELLDGNWQGCQLNATHGGPRAPESAQRGRLMMLPENNRS
jgi:hypothetical protein